MGAAGTIGFVRPAEAGATLRPGTALLLLAALFGIAAGGIATSLLPLLRGASEIDAVLVRGALTWSPIVLTWLVLFAAHARPLPRLWRLPSALFRWTATVGVPAVAAGHLVPLALRLARPDDIEVDVLIVAIADSFFDFGVIALASLAAFAVARLVLRPTLAEIPAPSGRDVSVRTRVFAATAGASFATVGTTLDLRATGQTEEGLIQLVIGLCAVVFATSIGLIAGKDASDSLESVIARVRELGRAPFSAGRELRVDTLDEVGDLVAALGAVERRMRMQEAETAASLERERIARDLHDGVAKSVSALALELAALAGAQGPVSREALARVERIAWSISRELRVTMRDFRVHSEVDGLRTLVQRAVAPYPGTVLRIEGDLDRVDPLARYQAARMLQEALGNARTHAHATAVTVLVSTDEGALRVVVEDDGIGIPALDRAGLAAAGHFGLLGIDERARSQGGTAEIGPRPGGGTRVAVQIPLGREAA